MEPLSSLHLLAEAVRNAGADIAPTYQEYIQLAFAIATDCGEAGRHDFLSLCSLSSKFDRRAADKLFTSTKKRLSCHSSVSAAYNNFFPSQLKVGWQCDLW